MLDFTPVRERKITLSALARSLSRADLARLTNEMIDTMLDIIEDLTDADVVFTPQDPKADDPDAVSDELRYISWTVGHIVVHATATAEEAVFLAAEMARGVTNHGGSRYETPWETITTLADCRVRLEESRRIRLGSLSLWPDAPHFEVMVEGYAGGPQRNCKARFVGGLAHDDAHLEQLKDVVRQARTARGAA